jgi:predicted nucleic acid-binding protein
MNSGFVLDTNIILYSLAGDKSITKTLAREDLFISAMTRMEALVYHGSDARYLPKVKEFLEECFVVEIKRAIQDLAVEIRMAYKLQLQDAVIAATAVYLDRPLLTADQSFFKAKDLVEVVLYKQK